MSHLWPGVTPHRAGMPGSVWDLDINTWLTYVTQAEQVHESRKRK